MKTEADKIEILARFKNILLDKYDDELLKFIHNSLLFSVHNLSEILSLKLTIYIVAYYFQYFL